MLPREILDLPQEEQDELYDFYCRYGQWDQDGKPIGLFKTTRAVIDDAELDVPWADFSTNTLAPQIVAQTDPDADESAQRARAVDAYFASFET
jgi:hypothetical protein